MNATGATAHPERSHRIGRAAAIHVGRREHRPPHHRVHEQRRIHAGHEFLIDALLADLDVVFPVEELLHVPEFPQTRRAGRRDAADRLQVEQIVLAEASAVDLQGATTSYNRRFVAMWGYLPGMLARLDATEMAGFAAAQTPATTPSPSESLRYVNERGDASESIINIGFRVSEARFG